MKKPNEKGVALILTMILLLLISVMGVSLMFVSQTETWSSLNYRLMSQARDGAEAGVNATANYLMFTYAAPGTVADPLSNYNMNASPVQYPAANTTGHDVILSASGVTSNYPVSAVQSAFNTTGTAKGNFTAGYATVNYATSAKLINMQQLGASLYLSSPTTVQTWQITSDGTISGVRSATEEVTATLEQPIVPVFGYAAFATSSGCSALTFGGGTTNSYNSGAALVSGLPVTSVTDGNVGTNGNLSTNGNPTTINGNLSTPRTGTGTCTANNVTAWTSGTGHVTGSIVELPQTVVYPIPTVPAAGSVSITTNTSCPTMTGTGGTCTKTGNIMTIAPSAANGTVSLADLSLTGNKNLHLAAGTYNINTLKETGNTQLVLDSVPVILQVTGTGGGTVVDLTGGSVTNTMNNFDPATFQIIYAGTGNVTLNGGANAVGLLYAPNASYSFAGNGDWYGSVIGASLTNMGGAAIHYDRKLKDKFYVPGPFMLNSLTWNKY